MLNPFLNKKHLREYLLYGLMAAVAFLIPALIFIFSDHYENSYYLYIGTAFYMIVMFLYSYRLLYKPYERKRAASMLISGHMANAVGVIASALFSIIACIIHFPDLFSQYGSQEIVNNTPPQINSGSGSEVLMMVLVVTLLGNGSAGSFVSVITTYAGKQNQTKDKATSLETNVPEKHMQPRSV
jgi:hypothetical protein